MFWRRKNATIEPQALLNNTKLERKLLFYTVSWVQLYICIYIYYVQLTLMHAGAYHAIFNFTVAHLYLY